MVSVRPPTVAVLAAVAAVVVYAVMWVGYRQDWSWLHFADSSSLAALHGLGVKRPLWVRFWDVVCTVIGPTTFRLLGALAVVAALVKRKLRAAAFLLVSVQFSEFVTQVAKGLAGRPRPVTALVYASSSSFPSGHALEVMVAVLALLAVLAPAISRPLRVAVVAAGVLIVLAVGFGRVALNVHYPSDVLAGWALGYLYFALCAWVIRLQRLGSASMAARTQPQPEADQAGENDTQQDQHPHVEQP